MVNLSSVTETLSSLSFEAEGTFINVVAFPYSNVRVVESFKRRDPELRDLVASLRKAADELEAAIAAAETA